MMETEIISDRCKQWDEYVENHLESTVEHRSGWIEVIQSTFGHRPYYLQAKSGGKIKGVLPLFHINHWWFGSFLVSVPFLNYGGMCCDDEEACRILQEKAISIGTDLQVSHIEFRNIRWRKKDLPTRMDKVKFAMDINKSEEDIYRSLRKQVRNRIKKGLKTGLYVEKGPGQLKTFYALFCISMREHGTPVMPLTFFSNILSAFKEKVKILIAYKDGAPVGAKFSMLYRDTYYLLAGAYPREHRELVPNYFLTWESIRQAKSDGARVLDFGRSRKESGAYQFKKYFGASESQIFWEYWLNRGNQIPYVSPQNKKYRLAIEIWKRIPLVITQRFGPHIAKYLA